ncbi:hypothetical protein [Taklimakanibacter lacteus]|uniref:hypothetical protein n=1 Tax=Taklimakanibacter lacteus TaxID=2268456 RepID=UPI000E674D1D
MDLAALVARNLDRRTPADVQAIADHVRGRHAGTAAILAYGSCLRGVSTQDSLIDLYLLVERDEGISASPLSRIAARLLPPNVYYAEMSHSGRTLRCKYAVMTLGAFAERMKPGTTNPYFWARFSQPAILVHASDEASRKRVVAAVADAVATMYGVALATAPEDAAPVDIWRRGFEETYRTELRPEADQRAGEIAAANASFYEEAARLIGRAHVRPVSWSQRRLAGKFLSLARLIKAGFTFEGGASYAAWKIERHSGEKITLTPWQQRHPVLAGLMLLPRLLRRGALK